MEGSLRDWLFGCNPWGTSMIVGLPQNGDTPADPHSAFTALHDFPIDGGLIDGPVYGSIFNNLRGIHLAGGDEYAPFQSDLRSEEHTSELQSLMRNSYAVFCLKK